MKIFQFLFLPLAWLYGLIIVIRNWCYKTGIFQTTVFELPIISVGNITAGGTGKTPLVEYLISYFMNKKKRVAVISRGYKRATKGTIIVSDGKMTYGTARTAGDEPYQIARKFTGVAVIADKNRSRAAKYTIERYNPDVILLDDAFQHLGIARQLDIVLIDIRRSIKKTLLLPAGLRREPINSLKRADLIALSGISVPKEKTDNDFRQYTRAPVIRVQLKPKRLVEFSTHNEVALSEVRSKTCVAFCGIGNPVSFSESLDRIGLKVEHFFTFPDHHYYCRDDIQKIQRVFENKNTSIIITTEKDAMRLLSLAVPGIFPLKSFYYLDIEAEITEGEEILHNLLEKLMKKTA